MKRRLVILGMLVVLVMGAPIPKASADNDLIGGIGDVLAGATALPMSIIEGTLSGPPILGTLSGALLGTARTLGFATRGLLRLAGVALPLALRLAPYVPVFL